MNDDTVVQIPDLISGTWDIDPNHSEMSFVIEHLGISHIRGRFDKFTGTIVIDPDLSVASAHVSIEADSVDSNQPIRDELIRSDKMIDAAGFPTMTFASTGVRMETGRFVLDGDLTIRGNTHPVSFDVELHGFSPDNFGNTRVSFSAETVVNRLLWGVAFNAPIPGTDKMLLADTASLVVSIEAILRKDGSAG